MKPFLLASFALLCATAAIAEQSYPLTMDGLGPVKLGMTQRAAEKALGVRLKIDDASAYKESGCGYLARTDGRSPDVLYMIMDGRITRIDIDVEPPARSLVRVKEGIGIGSSETEILRAFGKSVKVEPHPYLDEQGHYLVVDSKDHKRGLIFETEHGKVTTFRAGLYPSLGFIEGCS